MKCYFCGKNIGFCCGDNSSLKKYEIDFSQKVKVCYECEVMILSTTYCVLCRSPHRLPFNKKTKRFQILSDNRTMLLNCNCYNSNE